MSSLVRQLITVVVAVAGAALVVVSPTRGSSLPSSGVPIKHVVEVMLENHTFDDLFSSFPGANGIPPETTFPNPLDRSNPSDRITPLSAPSNEADVQGGLNNSRSAELTMMDRAGASYRMDGYTLYQGEGLSSITTFSPPVDPNLQNLAHHFELADDNFQPAIASTLPNVLYALAATAHGYLTNSVPADGRAWRTIFTQLSAARRSWRIYAGVPLSDFAGTVWADLLPSGSAGGLTSTTQFFSDLSGGRLPDFSFVRPGIGYSEEPPEDVSEGDAWLGQVIEAIARSSYWNSTAIFVTYDEGGGFFDHVSPPIVRGSSGYGTRTPMVIVSPWVRRGVFHARTTNISVLAFAQHLWGLRPLNALDARQNDLAGAFDFRRSPLRPPSLPVSPRDTIGFYSPNGNSDVTPVNPGQPLVIIVQQNTRGLALDERASGRVKLSVTPPVGFPVPSGFPSEVEFDAGRGRISATFTKAGYYRIAAHGPGGSAGWLTVDVGVNANTP